MAKEPLQELLIQARRDQILDAAAKVFAEKGFHPTTIRDIAREAGLADGTIYNYFENKTALLLGIFERARSALQGDLDPAALAEPDLRQFLSASLRQPLIALQGDNFALFRVVIAEMLVNQELRTRYYQQILEPMLAMAEAHLRQYRAQQRLKPVDEGLVIRMISSLVMGLIVEYVMGDERLAAQWETLPDTLADLLLSGLEADER